MQGGKNEILNNSRLYICRSGPLCGCADIGTSKNAVLPMMAAAMLTKENVTIRSAPRISDVEDMAALLRSFGATARFEGDSLMINAEKITATAPKGDMAGRLRASFLFMGPLLAREGSVTMPSPGGCRIGARPIDLHIKGLCALGAECRSFSGYVHMSSRKLKGAKIRLDYPSVGATENILMAACLAQGETELENAAAEPEVEDLIGFLVSMGAEIECGPKRITIKGKDEIHGTDYMPIPDRIEAGTLILAAAVTGGDVFLRRAQIKHIEPVCTKVIEAGAEIFPLGGGLRVKGRATNPLEIISAPYPGFPTDMQAPFMAACCAAEGVSTIDETVFENRFLHAAELKKMGAQISVDGSRAVIKGTGKLKGAQVTATDLRAGAALCIAALFADGETVISDTYHIDRGYEALDEKFRKLGAKVTRE